MFKNLFFSLCLIFAPLYLSENIYAQEQLSHDEQFAVQAAFNELIYTMGMKLAEQELITDEYSAQQSCLNLYYQIPQVEQIVKMFLMLDEEMLTHKIETVEQLIEYVFSKHYDFAMAAIVWVATFQNVFVIFKTLHPHDVSYQAWNKDVAYLMSINSPEELEKLGQYIELYEACSLMIEAQMHLEYEFKALA